MSEWDLPRDGGSNFPPEAPPPCPRKESVWEDGWGYKSLGSVMIEGVQDDQS